MRSSSYAQNPGTNIPRSGGTHASHQPEHRARSVPLEPSSMQLGCSPSPSGDAVMDDHRRSATRQGRPSSATISAESALQSVHPLLERYRREVEQLRQEVSAGRSREARLTQQMHGMVVEYAKLRQHHGGSHVPGWEDGVGAATHGTSAGRGVVVEGATSIHHTEEWQAAQEYIAALEEEVAKHKRRAQEAELHLRTTTGRLAAYEEAINKRTNAAVRASPQQENDGNTDNNNHVHLCQCLSATNYLVKVFNAMEHCTHTKHQTPDGCSRSLLDCTQRCLQAAAKGSTEGRSDLLLRGEGRSTAELIVDVREELAYCEVSAVRLAARHLHGGMPPPSPESETLEHSEASAPTTTSSRSRCTSLDGSNAETAGPVAEQMDESAYTDDTPPPKPLSTVRMMNDECYVQ